MRDSTILRKFFLGGLVTLSLLVVFAVRPVSPTAQGTVTWDKPRLLSNPDLRAGAPAMATDAAGNVHIMWAELSNEDLQVGEGDALVYTRWDGRQWTPPRDVLVSPSGGVAHPSLAMTADGVLHAVWATGGQGELMYAQAPACCADNVRSWSSPVSLGGPVNLTTALAADDRGRLHAAFASLDTGNIVYRRSDDGGATWRVWVDIWDDELQEDEYTAYPRLAVDGRGRVHLVWSVLPWPGRRVLYARSEDGGDTWSAPQVIDSYLNPDYAGEGYGPTLVDVEVRGEDEVHLIWDGAPTVERNHIWSSDGGETWSSPVLLFPELTRVGRSGWNDMVVDSAGTLHAVACAKPWHASWSGGEWSSSTALAEEREQILGRPSFSAEWMGIALSLGNQVHVAWLDYEPADSPSRIWYVRGQTSAPAVEAQALPLASSIPALAPTLAITATPTSTSAIAVHSTPYAATGSATLTSSPPAPNVAPPSSSPGSPPPLLVGAAAALVVVSIAFLVRLLRLRRA